MTFSDSHPTAAERVLGPRGHHLRKFRLLFLNRDRDVPSGVDALVSDLENTRWRGILQVTDRGREDFGAALDGEIEEPHLRDIDHQSFLFAVRENDSGGKLDHGSRNGNPDVDLRVQMRDGLEPKTIPKGDVQ